MQELKLLPARRAEAEQARALGPEREAGQERAPGLDAVGGIVSAVRPDGPAARAGLRVGDRLVAIDGVVPRDLSDLRFQTQGRDRVRVDSVRDGVLRTARLSLGDDLDVGLDFEQPTFDGLRQCNNNCEFCFIRGLPKGLRRSLYVRDDDYRYSFLFGSFITLTNLAPDDWDRIAYQRLSPLRVSIHATDPDVRARLLAHPGAPAILPQLRWLGRAGITVHGQVVLCPGINDGAVLDQTIQNLAGLPEVVESVAVVPVGISEHLRARDIRTVTTEVATETVEAVLRWNRVFRRSLGRGFVFPSDELFLLAGKPLPGSRFYEDFPQLQNGVGLIRVMLDDWRRRKHRLPALVPKPRHVAWLCGRAAAPALRSIAEDFRSVEGLTVHVRVVENTLFGSAISVSGLMSGRDIIRTLKEGPVDVAVLPRSAFGFEGERTLDDWTVAAIEAETGVPIRLGRGAGDVLQLSIE